MGYKHYFKSSGADKFIRKKEREQTAREFMRSDAFRKYEAEMQVIYMTNAFVRFCYLMMEYLEAHYHVKEPGLRNLIEFLKRQLIEIKNEDFWRFVDSEDYYRDTYGIDLFKEFNVRQVIDPNEEENK